MTDLKPPSLIWGYVRSQYVLSSRSGSLDHVGILKKSLGWRVTFDIFVVYLTSPVVHGISLCTGFVDCTIEVKAVYWRSLGYIQAQVHCCG